MFNEETLELPQMQVIPIFTCLGIATLPRRLPSCLLARLLNAYSVLRISHIPMCQFFVIQVAEYLSKNQILLPIHVVTKKRDERIEVLGHDV